MRANTSSKGSTMTLGQCEPPEPEPYSIESQSVKITLRITKNTI